MINLLVYSFLLFRTSPVLDILNDICTVIPVLDSCLLEFCSQIYHDHDILMSCPVQQTRRFCHIMRNILHT